MAYRCDRRRAERRATAWSCAWVTVVTGLLLLLAGEHAHAQAPSGPALAPPSGSLGGLQPETLPPPAAATVQRQLVVDVEIKGNASTKDYQVQKHIQTRKDREFDSEVVQGDVRRLVSTGLFRDVRTYTRPASGGVIVIYEVFERPRVQFIRHLGNRGMSEKKLLKEHGIRVGDAINAYSTEEGRRKIEELYHRGGFPAAQVTVMEGDKQGDKGVIYLINEGQIERVASVVFEGNTVATDARLKTQIESKPGILWYFFRGKVDRQKIDADIEKLTAYYRSLGYFRARVGRELEFDDAGKWLTLKFVIDEGPRYVVRNVSIEGNQKFASPPLLDFLALKSGAYFNQAEMNKDVNTIIDLYGSQGHVFADVQADPRFLEEPGQLDLIYRVKEGQVFTVGEVNVNIAGEFPHTRDSVVLTRLSLRPGDIIDTRKLRDSERRLKSSQLFETNPQQGEPPKIVVRPPNFDGTGAVATVNATPTAIRGQSPEGPDENSREVRAPLHPTHYYQPTAVSTPARRTTSSLYSWEAPGATEVPSPQAHAPVNSSGAIR